jgi:hypothetical protein
VVVGVEVEGVEAAQEQQLERELETVPVAEAPPPWLALLEPEPLQAQQVS